MFFAHSWDCPFLEAFRIYIYFVIEIKIELYVSSKYTNVLFWSTTLSTGAIALVNTATAEPALVFHFSLSTCRIIALFGRAICPAHFMRKLLHLLTTVFLFALVSIPWVSHRLVLLYQYRQHFLDSASSQASKHLQSWKPEMHDILSKTCGSATQYSLRHECSLTFISCRWICNPTTLFLWDISGLFFLAFPSSEAFFLSPFYKMFFIGAVWMTNTPPLSTLFGTLNMPRAVITYFWAPLTSTGSFLLKFVCVKGTAQVQGRKLE